MRSRTLPCDGEHPAAASRLAFAAGALLLLAAPDVLAATFRYASSSNRIYVENGGTATLSAIKAALPSAPLDQPAPGVWLLRASLFVEDGSAVLLHGAAIGGDVDELRLKSDGSTVDVGFVRITAEYGTLDIRSTRILSWNGSGPDPEYATGRAYIRVRSFLDGSGVARESRMDIVDSDLGHLGYNASESYGLVWKVIGSATGLYDKVNVYGDIINSRIHHNYFGVYTFGHEDGQWLDNEVDSNAKYGFDPHDDSDFIRIAGNVVHHNGNHGIIASQRCNNIEIVDNDSYANTGNGIMLHRSSNDALVENNDSYGNTDSGIAIFASSGITVRNNRLLDPVNRQGNANAGIRLSVGAADNVIENNDIGFSGKYGLYFYKGSDTPNAGDDGRPKRNVLQNNFVHDGISDAIKLTDADDNTFLGNIFERNNSTLRFTKGRDNALANNAIPADVYVRLTGSASLATTLRISEQPFVRLQVDSYGSGIFSDADSAIFDPEEAVYTVSTPAGSSVTLAAAQIGTTSAVHTRNFLARPASGSVQVNPTLWNTSGDFARGWNVRAGSSSVQIAYTVGDLVPGVAYDVQRGTGTFVGTFTADAGGRIAFAHAAGTTSTVSYSVKPH
jgi:parallel beta-helix repeat protein